MCGALVSADHWLNQGCHPSRYNWDIVPPSECRSKCRALGFNHGDCRGTGRKGQYQCVCFED